MKNNENLELNPLLEKTTDQNEIFEYKGRRNFRYVGNILCLFVSWYKEGKMPIFNLGPSFCPCILMMCLATFILAFFTISVTFFCNEPIVKIFMFCTILYNLYLFLSTLLGNPGIDENIIKHYNFVENGGSF